MHFSKRFLRLAGVLLVSVVPLCALVDRDGDGVSDVWAALYPEAGAAAADSDGDGLANRDEAAAGTNPLDGGDRFAVTPALDDAGRFVLRWPSVAGKRYGIEHSPDLAMWMAVDGSYEGAGGELAVPVSEVGVPAPERQFWRVAVLDPDSDDDGLSDWEELQFGTNLHAADTDSDGLLDGVEATVGTDPLVADDSSALPVAGARLHLRADIGVEYDADGFVSMWRDVSGQGHDAVQSSTSRRPIYQRAAIAGRCALDFDGIDDVLRLPNLMNGASAGEIFVVARLDDRTARINGICHFGTGDATGYSYADGLIWDDFGTTTEGPQPGPAMETLAAPHILNSCITPDGVSILRFNGEEHLRRTGQPVSFRADPVLGSDYFGEWLDGAIAEVIIFDYVLSAEERQQILQCLAGRYHDQDGGGIPKFADSDGDGLLDVTELDLGTDPNDYYNGLGPSLTIKAGNNQYAEPGSVLSAPVLLLVCDGAGRPLRDAPVTCTVATGEGKIGIEADQVVQPTLTLRTDAAGCVAFYWQLGFSEAPRQTIKILAAASTIEAMARSRKALIYTAILLEPAGRDIPMLYPGNITENGWVLLHCRQDDVLGFRWFAGSFFPLNRPSWQARIRCTYFVDDWTEVTYDSYNYAGVRAINNNGDVIGFVATDVHMGGVPYDFSQPAFWPVHSNNAQKMSIGGAKVEPINGNVYKKAESGEWLSSGYQRRFEITKIDANFISDAGVVFGQYQQECWPTGSITCRMRWQSASGAVEFPYEGWDEFAAVSPDGNHQLVLRNNRLFIDEETTGPASGSDAYRKYQCAINNRGRAVAAGRWFEKGRDLAELGPGVTALAINNSNDILARNPDGSHGIWVWQPPTDRSEASYRELDIVYSLPEALTVSSLKGLSGDRMLLGTVRRSGKEIPAIFVRPPQLAVDANRDGEIKLASEDDSDATSAAKPFRFWINDDIDRVVTYTNAEQISDFIASHVASLGVNEVEEDDTDTDKALEKGWAIHDWANNRIQSKRDLEDFARLWISMQGLGTAFLPKTSSDDAEADLYLGFQWAEDGKEGHPSIKVYPAAETDGGTKYLNDTTGTVATEQLNIGNSVRDFRDKTTSDDSFMVFIRDTDFFVIPPRYFRRLSETQSKTFFLFEGATAGKGQLKLIILKKEGSTFTKIGEGPGVWMDLKEPGDFIQRWTCGDGDLGDVVNYTPNGAIAPPSTEEEKDMVLYVHGYNMKPNEKQRWIETTYKRLWHLGLKGKVGGFTWPCAQSALPFDESEEKAWQAGAQLKLLLSALKTAGYRVHVLAHSQGNVVMGEALRQAGPNSELVSTYIASQAAIPAHCYDKTLPEVDFSTNTPEIYGRYWNGGDQHLPETWPASSPSYLAPSRVQGGAGKFVNYYNPQDYALTGNGLSLLADDGSQPGWMTDQRMKPNRGYWYSNLVGFEEDPLFHLDPKHYAFPADRFTIFSYCAEARSLALGATSTGGVFATAPSVNLTDSSFSFRNQHIYHSAQFRSFYAARWQYWKQVLQSCDVDVRPQP